MAPFTRKNLTRFVSAEFERVPPFVLLIVQVNIRKNIMFSNMNFPTLRNGHFGLA